MLEIPEPWLLLCLAFGIMLAAAYIMSLQGRHFLTMDPVRRNFAMMDLEFPAQNTERPNILSGIFRLKKPDEKSAALRALKWQLIIDFLLFMPGAYGSIFIICMQMAHRAGDVGKILLAGLHGRSCCALRWIPSRTYTSGGS